MSAIGNTDINNGTATTIPPQSEWYEHSRALWPIILAVFLETLAISAVALRIWSLRLSRKQRLAGHDWAILAGLVFSTCNFVMLILATVLGGLGQHTLLLSDPAVQLVHFGKIYVANSPLWAAAISSVKISILLLYMTIFHIETGFIIACKALFVIQFLWFVGVVLASLLLCQPIALNWDPTLQGQCGSKTVGYLFVQIINLLLDVCVAILPIPVLRRLQMRRRKKIQIAGVFALGVAICAITIARIVLMGNLVEADATYSSSELFFFTMLEPLLGVVLACLPVLRPAMVQIGSVFSSSHGTLMDNRDYDSTRKPREHGSTLGSNGQYSTISGDHYAPDSDLRPINPPDAYMMEPIGKGNKHNDQGEIIVTNSWDVNSSQKTGL